MHYNVFVLARVFMHEKKTSPKVFPVAKSWRDLIAIVRGWKARMRGCTYSERKRLGSELRS
jgi:hypothetical protein